MTPDLFILSRNSIVSLLSNLETSGSLPLLSQKVVVRITKVILAHTPCDKPLLDIITPLVIKFLRNVPTPKGTDTISYQPPQVVQAAFILACKLSERRENQKALDVFQVLTDTNSIPAEAICEVGTLSQDFGFLICSTIIRSCLHWNWRQQAVELLLDVVKSAGKPDKALTELVVDTMYTLLETPSASDIANCGILMREPRLWTDTAIPHGLFRLFYDSAQQMDQGEEAESLFAHSRNACVVEMHQYPPPQGRALTWLMRYLTLDSRNMHLGRILAKEVVENHEPIPLRDRADFIAITASHGYSTQARALWERYALTKDRTMIIGNAATMVRMVSLFANMAKKASAKMQESSLATTEFQTPSAVRDIRKSTHNIHYHKLKEFTSFAERVVAEFRQTIEPLLRATHYELTSLARAYFLLGNVTDGFNTLKTLIDRKEVPDMHDVNVALSAIAEHNPRGAALIIERMIEKGLKPDTITFATVLHHAILQKDEHQVTALVHRARELGIKRLTQKTLSSLIQSSLKATGGSRHSVRLKLERIIHSIQTMTDSRFVCTPNMGKSCIFASLRVDDPRMAYKFWALLLRGKTEWEDGEQRFQRRLIADRIRKHCKAGWLNREEGIIMLSQLVEKFDPQTVRRR